MMKLKPGTTGAASSIALVTFVLMMIAGPAIASNETSTISLRMDPLQGGLFKEIYKPVNWQVGTVITTPDQQIEPMKQSKISISGRSITFNPDPDMPVCPDSKINPNTVSVPVEAAIAACPDSIIGNGTAKFALNQYTALPRGGVILIFNGGFQKSGPLEGQPRIMVYSYSYDVEVGVYSEGALSKDGRLDFDIPVLPADSSLTSLNANIPGKPMSVEFPLKGITANLPAGQDPRYARARCATGSWSFAAEFLLGDRPEGGPPGPVTTLNERGVKSCFGATGKAKFGALKIKGPTRVKPGRKVNYKVTIGNNGTATAKAVRLVVSGRGVTGKAGPVSIAPGRSRVVTIRARFASKGRVRVRFKATAARTAARAGVRPVTVG